MLDVIMLGFTKINTPTSYRFIMSNALLTVIADVVLGCIKSWGW